MPVDILAIYSNKKLDSYKYPKAKMPPSEFKPRLLPGAHYKLALNINE